MGHSDLFPVYGAQRGAKNAFGSKTSPHVHCLVEPLVLVGIVNNDPFVFGEGPTGDTLGVENADFPPEIALGNSRIEFTRRWIIEKNRASLRTYGGSGYLDENLGASSKLLVFAKSVVTCKSISKTCLWSSSLGAF